MSNMDNPSPSPEKRDAHEVEEIKQARDRVDQNLIDIYLQKRDLFPERARDSPLITNTTLIEVNHKEVGGGSHFEEDAGRAIGKQQWIAQELWNARIAPTKEVLTEQVKDALALEDRQNVMQNFYLKMYNAVFRKEARMEYSSDLEWYGQWEEYFKNNPNLVRQIKFQANKDYAIGDLISTMGNDRQDPSYRDPSWVGRRLVESQLKPNQFDSNPLVKELKAIYGSDFNQVEQEFLKYYAGVTPDDLSRYSDMPYMVEDARACPFSLEADLIRLWQDDPRVKKVLESEATSSLDDEEDEPLPISNRNPLINARKSGFWPAIRNKFSSIREIKNFVIEKGTDALVGSVIGAGIRWGVTAAVGPGMMASAMVGATAGGFKAFGREINKNYENYLDQRAQAGDKASAKELEKIRKQNNLEKNTSRLKVRELIRKYNAVPPDQKSETLRKTQMGAILGLVGGVVGYDLAHNHPEVISQVLEKAKTVGSNIYEMASISKILDKIPDFNLKSVVPDIKVPNAVSDFVNSARENSKKVTDNLPAISFRPGRSINRPGINDTGANIGVHRPGIENPQPEAGVGVHRPGVAPESNPVPPGEAISQTAKPIKIDIPQPNIGIPTESTVSWSESSEHIKQYLAENHIDSPLVRENQAPDEYYSKLAAEIKAQGQTPDFDGSFSSLKGDVEAQIGNYLLHKPEILKDPAVIEWVKSNRPEVKLESFTTQSFDKNNVDHLTMLKAYQKIHPDYYNKMFTTMYGSTKILNSDNPAAFNAGHPDLFKHGVPLRRPDSDKLFDKILSTPSAASELGHTYVSPFRSEDNIRLSAPDDVKIEIPQPNVALASETESTWLIEPSSDPSYLEKKLYEEGIAVEDFKLTNPDTRYTYNAATEQIIHSGLTPDLTGDFSSLKGQVEGLVGDWILGRSDIVKELQAQLAKDGYVPSRFNFANLSTGERTIVLKAFQKLYPEEYQKMFTDMYGDIKVLNINNPDVFNTTYPDLFKHDVLLKRPSLSLFDQYIAKKS